ncbi:hypothetical protein VOLCADRAFT_99473 [Volvox carteri f. nagariensis]|uniref:Uncharacterized protein n=1 Tax=Volvox carteri f. nagariensis TaxID=3068 RepID=D8UHW2_VOLCA|nr:uncharacterized protein VOLCADRAFT_99473 [Volvox carteri f. nagariensis]EFJ40708.1 hypothetical protein VOLCADRAFT_99473 [Volvox carteri f. nagariensis]|eukprot:XP_002958254.1 hypothetical protein VOLCADRAFT_99473 [Volvox carteri f. nagariensis]
MYEGSSPATHNKTRGANTQHSRGSRKRSRPAPSQHAPKNVMFAVLDSRCSDGASSCRLLTGRGSTCLAAASPVAACPWAYPAAALRKKGRTQPQPTTAARLRLTSHHTTTMRPTSTPLRGNMHTTEQHKTGAQGPPKSHLNETHTPRPNYHRKKGGA